MAGLTPKGNCCTRDCGWKRTTAKANRTKTRQLSLFISLPFSLSPFFSFTSQFCKLKVTGSFFDSRMFEKFFLSFFLSLFLLKYSNCSSHAHFFLYIFILLFFSSCFFILNRRPNHNPNPNPCCIPCCIEGVWVEFTRKLVSDNLHNSPSELKIISFHKSG